jgi:hypothetical protein
MLGARPCGTKPPRHSGMDNARTDCFTTRESSGMMVEFTPRGPKKEETTRKIAAERGTGTCNAAQLGWVLLA